MEINLLLRLLIAHFLTDFVFQPNSWIEDRVLRKIKSKKLILHVSVTTLVAYLLSGEYSNWLIPVTIFISHYTIDVIKSYLKDNFSNFIIDQAAHISIIFLLWITVKNKWLDIIPALTRISEQKNLWIVVAGYVFVSWPLGIIIGKATQKWRNQIAGEEERERQKNANIVSPNAENDTDNERSTEIVPIEEQGLGLASAGKWIGICERILILTFVLMQQYTAIGFLMTAKSILRFSEKEANTQLKTEYVLIGTLVSFAASAMIGVLLQIALK